MCRCECKKIVDKQKCDKGFILNPSSCNCECNKSCNISEDLDYKNCKCRKKVFDLLVKKCSKNIEENEMIYNETLLVKKCNKNITKNKTICNEILIASLSNSCTLQIVLFVLNLVISVVISSVFIYIYWYLKNTQKFYCQYK